MVKRLLLGKQLQRLRKQLGSRKALLLLLIGALLFTAIGAYAGYMSSQRLRVNPATYQPLLHLIGRAESNDNYNAYFGNAGNSRTVFTDMTIAQVLNWQRQYIRNGSASSAVGRYQFMRDTLDGLVRELGISHEQKFTPSTQDQLAIALLERRGSEQYVNNELSDKEFAANLAKEWAALPRTLGDNPDASYYAGDGLNASRVEVDEVLKAIEPIGAQ